MINWFKYKIFAVFLTLTVLLIWTFNESRQDRFLNIVKSSFLTHTFLLEDIADADIRPSIEESARQIFFLETSCAEKCECPAELSDRKVCAIESTARLHPDHKIYVLIVGSDFFESNHKMDLLQKVFAYDNVYLRKVNLTKYTKDTPLEQFFTEKRYLHSDYMRTHLADILRILTLWKYGGIYLDSDIVCLKNMAPLGMNFAPSVTSDTVTNSMLNFGYDELGRSFAQQCVEELNNTFDGSKWGYNGPGLITRVLNRLCKTKLVDQMTTGNCSGFQVFPREMFDPVVWPSAHYYFTEENTEEAMNCIKDAYVAHIFNHMSSELQVMKTANVAYALLAKQYCPDMFNSRGSCF